MELDAVPSSDFILDDVQLDVYVASLSTKLTYLVTSKILLTCVVLLGREGVLGGVC